MKKMRNLPNFITSLRIIGAICLIFLAPFSPEFFALYTIVGITDVLDGFVARKTNSTSELGAKLDSVADILFYTVMVLRIFPQLLKRISTPIWVVVFIIVAIRVSAYILAFVKFHCFSSLHTYLSKLTGVSVFLTPYFYFTKFMDVFCIVLCVIAFASSLEELIAHIIRKTYSSNIKSIFDKE